MSAVILAIIIAWVIQTTLADRRTNRRIDAIRDWLYDNTQAQAAINAVLIDDEALRVLKADSGPGAPRGRRPEDLWMRDGLYSIGAPVLDRDVQGRIAQRKEGRN